MSFANSFSRNLLIDWIKICLNNSSQPNKERFFQWKQIIKCVWSLHYRVFSMLIATNLSAILSSEKHSENTKCPKKKQITVIKPKDFPNEKNSHLLVYYKIVILKNSKDFRQKHPWYYVAFDFTNKNTPPRMFPCEFSQIFLKSYFKEHLRTGASEIIQESSHDSFLFYKKGH